MACLLTQGHTAQGCKPGPGGIRRVLVTEFANKDTITVTAGAVTAIALQSTTLFRSYTLQKGKGKWTDAPNLEGGNVSFTPHIEFDLNTLALLDRQEMKLLALNTLIMIIETNSDEYLLAGYYNGMDMMPGSLVDGAMVIGEWKGLKMIFEGKEADPMLSVDSALIAALLVAAV